MTAAERRATQNLQRYADYVNEWEERQDRRARAWQGDTPYPRELPPIMGLTPDEIAGLAIFDPDDGRPLGGRR